MTRLLVIEACFYQDISEKLHQGAMGELKQQKIEADFIQVPGALEIPIAIRLAKEKSELYDGYVALGCVIRGETGHYQIVSQLSAQGLMKLGIEHGLAIGNGILSVENHAQAEQRADPAGQNKGAEAVKACLALIAIRKREQWS